MLKLRNLASKYGRKVAAAGTGAVVLAGNAMAAVPEGVTTAMNDMKTDGIAVATVFLVASIALIAFLFMRKGAKA